MKEKTDKEQSPEEERGRYFQKLASSKSKRKLEKRQVCPSYTAATGLRTGGWNPLTGQRAGSKNKLEIWPEDLTEGDQQSALAPERGVA